MDKSSIIDHRWSPSAPPVVVTEHLSEWYGEVSGLNDVSVAIPRGVTGLLGPNGAGKSTFMKLVTGQLAPSAGTVRVLGEPIWGNPALYARIGFCPDQDAFYERMTGRRWLEVAGPPERAGGGRLRKRRHPVPSRCRSD